MVYHIYTHRSLCILSWLCIHHTVLTSCSNTVYYMMTISRDVQTRHHSNRSPGSGTEIGLINISILK